MDIMQEMKTWVNKGSFRTITIQPHCHGVRVTLNDSISYKNTVTDVAETIERAFNGCLAYLPTARKRWQEEEIEELKQKSKEKAQELREIREQIKSLKGE